MKIKVHELEVGMIIGMDIRGLTNYPIIPMDTRVTREHIEILKAFLVEEVNIRENRDESVPLTVGLRQAIEQKREDSFNEDSLQSISSIFEEAVEAYAKEFTHWQSGMTLDISKVRSIIHKLISEIETEPQWFIQLPNCTKGGNSHARHSIMMALVAYLLAKQLEYDKGSILQIALAGCLADCGIAKIPTPLLKRLHLTNQMDIEEFKKHTWYSYQMIKDITTLKPEVKLAVYQHHERQDGSGYPQKEKDDRIHPYAFILAIADRFVDLTKEAPRRTSLEIVRMIIDEPQFNYQNIKPLANHLAQYSVGAQVLLSDGRIAEIKFKNKEFPLHPIIKCFEDGELINLNKRSGLFIKKIYETKTAF